MPRGLIVYMAGPSFCTGQHCVVYQEPALPVDGERDSAGHHHHSHYGKLQTALLCCLRGTGPLNTHM